MSADLGRQQLRHWALVLVVARVAGAGIAGYLLNVNRDTKDRLGGAAPALPARPPTTLAPVTPTAPPDPSASALPGLVVAPADVVAPVTVQSLRGGNQVTGQVTLDICNGTYPSEALRTARLQNAAVDDVGDVVFSTEAVLYKNADATASAFSELKATAATCPSAPVASPVGGPTVTTRFNAAPDATWPQTPTVDRVAFDIVTTDRTGLSQHSVAVYLRRGRALLGVYFSDADNPPPAIAGQTTMAGIVNVFAARMAQLPASVVNG
jgi:hypothetical protein